MAKTNGNLLQLMDAMIERAQLEKSAGNLDLASDAKSSHPSASADDGTQKAKEGERSAENSADLAKNVPDNVEEGGSKNVAGGSKKPTDTMGTQSMASDEVTGNVDTPKSTPSMASNPAVGPNPKTKYGSDQLIGEANALLAALAATLEVPQEKAAEEKSEKKEEAKDELKAVKKKADDSSDPSLTQQTKEAADAAELYKQAAAKHPADEEAGYVAAQMLIDYLNGNAKEAADTSNDYSAVIETITKSAEADAETYAGFMQGYQQAMHGKLNKQAQDPAALLGAMGGAPMGGGEAPADPAALAALAGGAPEGLDAGGLGGEMGGGGLDGGDDEAVIEALAEALDEAGVTPEELAQVVAEAQGGAPAEEAAAAGVAPEAGEAAGESEEPEEAGESEEEGKEAAAKAKPQVKAAATNKLDGLKSAVRNLIRG